ncbi:MAG: hypothetical protein R3D25_10065 [Geminicoccaceae bacterium]
MSDWIRANSLHEKDDWRCAWWSYNLSIRVVVGYSRSPGVGVCPKLRGRASGAAAALSRWYLETDLRGNLKVLLWGCASLPAEAGVGEQGEMPLRRELAWQILPDGVHYELSASITAGHGQTAELATLMPAASWRDSRGCRPHGACVHLTHPDGKIALFNDGGLEMAYAPALLWERNGPGGRAPPRGDGLRCAAGFCGYATRTSIS